MSIVEKYLRKIQEDYSNPIQTRPKPKPGITGENPDPEEGVDLNLRGPTGINVDLDFDDSDDYYRINQQISKIK